MGIPQRAKRTGCGWAAAAARWRAGISKSQQCHRTRGWLGRRAVGATPVGSTKGYGKRNFPQVRRTQLRLGRADAAHSGCPKHPPPTGASGPGASSASRGTARRTPARRRRRSATAKFRAGTWMVMGSCKNSPCKSSDGSALAWTASINRPRTRQESPCFPNVGDTQKRTTWLLFTIHRRRWAQMRRDPRWRKRRRGQDTTRTIRTGMRWQVAPNAVFGLEGTQRADSADEGHNEVRLRAALRF